MKLVIIAPTYFGKDYIPGVDNDVELIKATFHPEEVSVWSNDEQEVGLWLYNELTGHGRYIVYVTGHGLPEGIRIPEIPTTPKGTNLEYTPLDYTSEDKLFEFKGFSALLSTLPKETDVLCIFDCCYGGEFKLNYKYEHINNTMKSRSYYHYIKANVISISASDINSESFAISKGSLFTRSINKIMKHEPSTFKELANYLQKYYSENQINITSSRNDSPGLWGWVFEKPTVEFVGTVIYIKDEVKFKRNQKCPVMLSNWLKLTQVRNQKSLEALVPTPLDIWSTK